MFKYDLKKLKDEFVVIKDYEPEYSGLIVVPEIAKRNRYGEENEGFGIYEIIQFSDSNELSEKENLKVGSKVLVDKMYIDWDEKDFHIVKEDGIVGEIIEE